MPTHRAKHCSLRSTYASAKFLSMGHRQHLHSLKVYHDQRSRFITPSHLCSTNLMVVSTLGSRVASLSLGGCVGWQSRIDLVFPVSPITPSPAPDPSSLDVTSHQGASDAVGLRGSVKGYTPPPLPTPVERMMRNLPVKGQRPLLQHISRHPMTLADVEALVPALIGRHKIMDQMVINIGYFNARGLTSSSELEHMLIHILAVGDEQHYLYETTQARIELERLRYQHCERMQRQTRIKDFKGFKKTGRLRSSVQHCESIGDFSRSRLHSGPGLTDRKYPRVRLPPNDTRQVSVIPNLPVSRMDMEVEHCDVSTRTGSTPELQDARMGMSDKIVVKLPPKEPSSQAQTPPKRRRRRKQSKIP